MAPLLRILLCVAASLLCILSPCLATIYTVGGPAGWTTPSRAKVNYTDWAANTPFKVGDSLEFNYVYKTHTVLEVIRSDFRFCNKSNPIESFSDESGKTLVELSKPGNFYFIDGIGEHCEEGQKFQAKVSGVIADATAPSSDQPSSSPAMPPATAAASTLSSTSLLSKVVAILITMLSSQFI